MGCNQSNIQMDKAKLVVEQEKQCSGIVKVDPRLPLDERQVFKLKSSWKAIARHITETGIEMFVR